MQNSCMREISKLKRYVLVFVGVVCLMCVDGVIGMGMVCVVDDLGFWLLWVHLGIMILCGVGIRGSRYFPKAGIWNPEA